MTLDETIVRSGDGIETMYRFFYRGKDFFSTQDEAEAVARKMAAKKVKNLKKQIVKLERLALVPRLAFDPREPV